MDMKTFFNNVRQHVFNGSLSQPQVNGMEAIIGTAQQFNVNNPHHVANILAQVHHETGGYMSPIKETVYASSTNKNPSDSTVIARLDKAWAEGQLRWVETPYWRDGWFGRGMVQITHKDNYIKLGEALGIDLVADRDRALELEVSAAIAVVGMVAGLFTGRKLGDYNFPQALEADPKGNPRRIINGEDGTDKKIAATHRLFYNALIAAGFDKDEPAAPPTIPQIPTRTRSVIIAEIEKLVAELKAME